MASFHCRAASRRSTLGCSMLLLHACSGLQLATTPLRPAAATAVARAAPPAMIDTDVLIGAATLIVSVGGGIGLIAFTENAGKANEARENAQPCVECKAVKVVPCTICSGSGGARLLRRPSPRPRRSRHKASAGRWPPEADTRGWRCRRVRARRGCSRVVRGGRA